MSSGGGNWIGGLVGGIAAGAGVRGANRAAKSKNAYYEHMFSPDTVNAYAKGFNPWIWSAIGGQKGDTGFSRNLYNITNGVDTSAWTMTNPLNQINQGGNQNLARFQSLVGRNNSGGGLANMYALANLGGVNNSKANLMSQYGQWREAQNRADANWTLGQIQNSQGMGQNAVNNITNNHQFHLNFLQKLAAFGQGYASGEGGTQGPQQPGQEVKPTYYGQGTTDSFGNVPNDSNSNTGNLDPVTYPYGASNGNWGGSSNSAPNINSNSGSTIQSGGSNSTPNLWQQNMGINSGSNYGYGYNNGY